ncbi:MAG: hypothetical protein ACREE6_16645 [Limisphaerales bacterium]
MYAIGCILFWGGLIAGTIGNIMFLAVVFRYSTVWFFGCMFVPFVGWIYFLLNLKQTWKPALICTGGCVATFIGCWLTAVFAT